MLIRGKGSAIPERLQHVHCADVGSGRDCTELSCGTSNLCAVVHLCLLSDAVSTDSRAANNNEVVVAEFKAVWHLVKLRQTTQNLSG